MTDSNIRKILDACPVLISFTIDDITYEGFEQIQEAKKTQSCNKQKNTNVQKKGKRIAIPNGQWLMDLMDTMDTMDYRPLPLTIVHGVHGVH